MKITILAIAALAAVIVIYLVNPWAEQKTELLLELKPDFFMHDFVQFNTNKQGIVNQKLLGEKIDIYDKENYSLIKSPEITVNKKDGLEITLKSANAQMFNENKFLLSGDVHVTNNLPEFVETMTTPELWLYPKINFAETNKKVNINRASSTSKGTGAKFHIDVNKVELLSDATTIYNIETTHNAETTN